VVGDLTAENLSTLEGYIADQCDQLKAAHTEPYADAPVNIKKQIDDLQASIATGRVDPRSAVGQRFKADHIPGSEAGKAYAKMKRDEAAAYRLEWAGAKKTSLKTQFQYRKGFQRIDTTKGQYRNIGQVIVNQGGWQDPEAIRGSLELAKQCLTMGPPWIMQHPQTRRMLLLELDFSYSEEMVEKWEEYKCALKASAAPTSTSQAKAQAKARAKAASSKPPTTTHTSTLHDKNKKLWADAAKLKTLFLQSTAKSTEIIGTIADAPEWAWANNKDNVGELTSAMKELKSSVSPWCRSFVTEDLPVVKKRTEGKTAETELGFFLALRPKIMHVLAIHTKLCKRHGS
jgi:hypothetical protein